MKWVLYVVIAVAVILIVEGIIFIPDKFKKSEKPQDRWWENGNSKAEGQGKSE